MNLHPRTIYIGSGGILKIGNFAHARDLSEGSSADYDISRMKHTDFIAPEQLLKQPASLKTDIYSLGLIFAFIKHGKQ
jgi:serine/threonine protein kinase